MLKATILSRVNKICKRAETDIDDILLDALRKISRKTLALKTSSTSTTTAGQNYITKPTDMCGNTIDGLIIDAEQLGPISWDEFLSSKICGYCVYSGRIYFYPTYADSESYTLYYSQLHPSDLSSILFPDEYELAIVHLTAALLYEKYEIYDGIQAQMTLYENEIQGLMRYNDTPPVASYNGKEM
jgi:hypothetical protein